MKGSIESRLEQAEHEEKMFRVHLDANKVKYFLSWKLYSSMYRARSIFYLLTISR